MEPPEQLPMNEENRFTEQFKSFIEEKTNADEFSGAVLVTKDGKPVLEYVAGFANKERQILNDMETKFNLSSVNKMFTAVAIAQLVERGLLSFEDTAEKLLPNYPNETVKEQVSIHHLLTHTSGLGSFIDTKYSNEFLAARPNLKKITDVVNLFENRPLNRPLEFPIGEYHYSSGGYEVLGAIIEAISSRGYYDYIRAYLYTGWDDKY